MIETDRFQPIRRFLAGVFQTGLPNPPAEPNPKADHEAISELRLARPEESTLIENRTFVAAEIKDLQEVMRIYSNWTFPVGEQKPWRGFLRPTYDQDEIKGCIDKGDLFVTRDSQGKVDAFAVVIADVKSPLIQLEILALRHAQFFNREDKNRMNEACKENKIAYIASFAIDPDSRLNRSEIPKYLKALVDQFPDRIILTTCSYKPIPNERMRSMIEHIASCTCIGQFSTPWNIGRPGRDGKLGAHHHWIHGKWTSLIYEIDPKKS